MFEVSLSSGRGRKAHSGRTHIGKTRRPRWSRLAAWGLVALLVAIFPANVHMAMHPELFPDVAPLLLYVRLPL